MVRRRNKCNTRLLVFILLCNVFAESLPVERNNYLIKNVIVDNTLKNAVMPSKSNVFKNILHNNTQVEDNSSDHVLPNNVTVTPPLQVSSVVIPTSDDSRNSDESFWNQPIRPGQDIRDYKIDITFDGAEFQGEVLIDVRVPDVSIRDQPILLHVEDLDIRTVMIGPFSEDNAEEADYSIDDGVLSINPPRSSPSFIVIIQYIGVIRNDGIGIFQNQFDGQSYLGMNLFPTNARRVFPCTDELNHFAAVSFTFNGVPFNNIVVNSIENPVMPNEFSALQGPVHLWGMIAHNFPTVVIPLSNVIVYGRPGLGQDGQAGVAIQSFFNSLEEWTSKPYFEIIVNQDGRLAIVALPDTDVEWNALSSIAIWEPHIFMEMTHSLLQRKVGLVKIAEAMSRQWFGYVVYPNSWRSQWVFSGLATYAAYEIVDQFQSNPLGQDQSLLDMDILFVTDIIQESLLQDGYRNVEVLIPADVIVEEELIRGHINGILRYKAPAILRMLRHVLGDADYIHQSAQALLNRRALEAIGFDEFYGALEYVWRPEENKLIEDIESFLEPWVTVRGYPFIRVALRQGGLSITQEHFSFTTSTFQIFVIPLTYTTSNEMDFTNLRPVNMKENTLVLPLNIGDEDFVLFNIQGQGYYRVDYDDQLWERIIEALNDPERRTNIHPLNRATLIDDALNLARANKLDYNIALQVVLAMEHETEYAPWKAFIRNMDFLRIRLLGLLHSNDDLDQDIYLRMIRRTIVAFEEEIGFDPEVNVIEPAMVSLTRGMVMDHACRANYVPCIAAAFNWFYDPNTNNPTVNPNIPKDIRPAVYCTMVREGDAQVIIALTERLAIEPSHYERVVILESFGCSQDENFINGLLLETVLEDTNYGVEERNRIFAAIARSSYQNTRLAINFIRMRTIEIRNRYGGPRKLEELVFILAENAADSDLVFDLTFWITSTVSNLDDSAQIAQRALVQANENLVFNSILLNDVYNWIEENEAPKVAFSFMLLTLTTFVALFNF